MPPAVQLLAFAFALAMAYLSYVGFRRRQFGLGGFVFWETIWAGLVVVSLAPGLFQPLARTCLLYTSPSPRDLSTSRMPSSA